MNEPAAKPKSSWINLAVDYGPLLVFFLAYRWFSPEDGSDQSIGAVVAVTKSTMVFMVSFSCRISPRTRIRLSSRNVINLD